MLKPAMQKMRSSVLAAVNQQRLRRGLAGIDRGKIPIFFIFTPEIGHLAPFCIPQADDRFTSVLVMNAVSKDDVDWIRSIHPDLPLIELKHSLTRNSQSLLPHGDVLNDLFAVADGDFCIQDPDCFVTDTRFWENVRLEQDDYAGGPFWSKAYGQDHDLPYTYFVMFSLGAFQTIASKYGVDANVMRTLPANAQRQAESVGYGAGHFPNRGKDYFDTLQAFWVLSLAEGMKFREMPGERDWIYHIGGTSYLHKSDIELSHWDFWPLSVHYFNLRLLESPLLERFRERYEMLFDTYRSSDALLEQHVEFREGWRCAEIDKILGSVMPAAVHQ